MPLDFQAKINQGMIHIPTHTIRVGETTQTSSGGNLNNLNNKEALDNNPQGFTPEPTAKTKTNHNPAKTIKVRL